MYFYCDTQLDVLGHETSNKKTHRGHSIFRVNWPTGVVNIVAFDGRFRRRWHAVSFDPTPVHILHMKYRLVGSGKVCTHFRWAHTHAQWLVRAKLYMRGVTDPSTDLSSHAFRLWASARPDTCGHLHLLAGPTGVVQSMMATTETACGHKQNINHRFSCACVRSSGQCTVSAAQAHNICRRFNIRNNVA